MFDLNNSGNPKEPYGEETIDPSLHMTVSMSYDNDFSPLGGMQHSLASQESESEAELPLETVEQMASNHVESYLELFSNRFSSLVRRGKKGDWRATSRFHYLSDEEILETVGGKTVFMRACQADKTTKLAAIIIEEGSYYRTREGLAKLWDCLRCVGIEKARIYMFTTTRQWQILFYFEKPVDSALFARAMTLWLRRNGIVPGTAGIDVFPGTKALCLPLQPGFCWLNEEGHVIASRNEISMEAALAMLFSDFQKIMMDGQALMVRLDQILQKEV